MVHPVRTGCFLSFSNFCYMLLGKGFFMCFFFGGGGAGIVFVFCTLFFCSANKCLFGISRNRREINRGHVNVAFVQFKMGSMGNEIAFGRGVGNGLDY